MSDFIMKAAKAHIRWIAGCLAVVAVGWLLGPNPLVQTSAEGSTHATPVYYPAKAGTLSGHVIAVDPGHGGYDGGARAPGKGPWEKVYNLAISLKLRDALVARGATVVMTRNADYSLNDPDPPIRKKRQDMERRAALVLDNKAEILLSVHQNEYRNRSQKGPQVFYRKDCPAGETLASIIQKQMNDELMPDSRRRANYGDFYITSLGIPSALIECGFLSNANEEALLRDEEYQLRVAESIADGVVDWFALADKPVPATREDR